MAQSSAPALSGISGQGAGENEEDTQVCQLAKVHILPIGAEVEETRDSGSRLAGIAPELRRCRDAGEEITGGDILRHDGSEFAVIKCEPEKGHLGADTDYFLDGNPVTLFEKVQFCAWGPEELASGDDVFSRLIVPYLKSDFGSFITGESRRARLLHCNQVLQIGDLHLHVEATEPAGIGVVTNQTLIFTTLDTTPEFDKVHILPFQDTVPSAYDYNIFEDYLKPYLLGNKHKKFDLNELFTYHGVQFKVVACEPNTRGRIGRQTTIYCDGILHPSLRNLLPPELLSQVAQLPVGLQVLLLSTERTTRELEDVLTHRRGLFPETLAEVEKFTWPPLDSQASSQSTCVICLGEFADGDVCRRLPCRHVFHSTCAEEWLRRCTDCPICKDNVDRAIRSY